MPRLPKTTAESSATDTVAAAVKTARSRKNRRILSFQCTRAHRSRMADEATSRERGIS